MLISQPVTSCLTNHSELYMSRLLNIQSRLISIYRLQWQPSFGFEISVSSTLMTSGDPVVPDPLLALAGPRFPVATSSKRVSCTPPHRVGHGLDASMDWIGLDWVGLDWVEC